LPHRLDLSADIDQRAARRIAGRAQSRRDVARNPA
jgi:hypothetical protein